VKVIYHSADLDGHCSGAIVALACEDQIDPERDLIPIDYGQDLPLNLVRGETVYMCDFCLQPAPDSGLQPWDLMRALNDCTKLVWIDHHKSAIEAHAEWWRDVDKISNYRAMQGTWDSRFAACELTWQWFSPEPVPIAVQLLGRFDVWDHADPRVRPFQLGMLSHTTDPRDPGAREMWRRLFDAGSDDPIIAEAIRDGRAVQRFLDESAAKRAGQFSFETELDGLRCIAMCNSGKGSIQFESVWDPNRHDAMLVFTWAPGSADREGAWKCSLYSDREDVDVSAVAKKLGGGGHKGAAGFQCRELPFELR